MKSLYFKKGAGYLICAWILVSLTGCSVSFGGFRLGGERELVFVCGETVPVEEEPEAVKISAGGMDQEASSEPLKESAAASTETGVTADGKVDLNAAGLEELMTLNGIGETRAKAIMEYRTQNGSFTKEEDIMQVPGIKEGIYTKIQDQIIVR